MKKKLIITLAAVFMAITPAMSQIFIVSEDEWNSNRAEKTVDQIGVIVAQQDIGSDQYLPLGSGIWVLGCLGGAYLLGKRRKKDSE